MANKNKNLNIAAKNKKDEFYTRREDIENELKHYKNHFKDKIVFCNCDDPYESEFFKFFAMRFNSLGLKKLIATNYVGSPVFQTEFSFDGTPNEIKILTGNVADEWRLWLQFDENFCKNYRAAIKNFSPVISKYKSPNVDEIYKNWLKNRDDNEENFINFAVHADWRVGQEICAEYQSKFEDVYFYVFSHQVNEILRACHDSDLPYIFNHLDEVPNSAPNLAKIIQKSWAAFAATGNPNNEFIPHWEKYSANNRQTMELNSKNCVCHKDLNTENLNSLRYIYEN